MKTEELRKIWKAEEALAHIHGWDFSHIDSRYREEGSLPWDYRKIILSHLGDRDYLLDMDTGGGEFLLSLGHPYSRTSATEAYPPNAELCRRLLASLGIDFREAPGNQTLPFADSCFDMVINRHGNYDAGEVNRILKPGGIFITQQVGEDNDRELVELLLPGMPKPFPGMNLKEQSKKLKESGFDILEQGEAFRPIRFFDVGALVWFAKIIEWEFPGFCVDGCLDRLAAAQALLESGGSIEGTIHRYMMTARKREPVYLESMY